MSDYISREAFIADCEGRYCAPCKEQGKDANGVRCRACWVDDMLSEVLDAPAADVEPVRHVHCKVWGIDGYYGEWLRCPNCGYGDNVVDATYCGGCGAKIDLEGETNDD